MPCAVNLPSPYFSSKFRARMCCRVCWIFDKAFVRFAEKMGDRRGVVRQNGAPEGLNEKRGVVVSKVRHNYPCWKYVDIPRLNPLESRRNATCVRFST